MPRSTRPACQFLSFVHSNRLFPERHPAPSLRGPSRSPVHLPESRPLLPSVSPVTAGTRLLRSHGRRNKRTLNG